MSVVNIDSSNFDTTLEGSDKPYLIDFWAEWCGPCRMVGPVVEAISVNLGDKINVGKVDIDANPDIASKYNIQSIPSLLIFKNGEVTSSTMGFQSQEQVTKWIEQNL